MRVSDMNTSSFRPQRKRLWELEHRFHCTVAGTCLTLDELRKLCIKSGYKIPAQVSDYELHCSFVTAIGQTGPLAKRLQKYLDRKFQAAVPLFKQAGNTLALEKLWQKALEEGDIAGPFWATLTHPLSDDKLLFRLFGDVHMLSHLSGASMRIDLEQFSQLRRQVPILKEQLERLQRESQKRLQNKEWKIQALQRQVERLGVLKHQLEDSRRRLQALENSETLTQLQHRLKRLQNETEKLSLQRQRQEIELHKWRERAESAQRAERRAQQDLATVTEERNLLEAMVVRWFEGKQSHPEDLDLGGREVLYIGGRHRQWPCFRALVERHNGHFLGHDGGREDSRGYLDTLLSRANLVICPLDQVSHDAAQRLKRECKRRDKRFLLLPRANLSAFARGLRELASDEVSLCA